MATLSKERRDTQSTKTLCDAAAARCARHTGIERCRSGTNTAHLHPMRN